MMKMKQEHFNEIKRLIEEYIETEGGTEAMVKRYETGDFNRPLAVNDLQTRFLLGHVLQRGYKQDKCSTVIHLS